MFYVVERFSGPTYMHDAYLESVSDNLARLDKSSRQSPCDSVFNVLKTVGKNAIGLRPKQVAKEYSIQSSNPCPESRQICNYGQQPVWYGDIGDSSRGDNDTNT